MIWVGRSGRKMVCGIFFIVDGYKAGGKGNLGQVNGVWFLPCNTWAHSSLLEKAGGDLTWGPSPARRRQSAQERTLNKMINIASGGPAGDQTFTLSQWAGLTKTGLVCVLGQANFAVNSISSTFEHGSPVTRFTNIVMERIAMVSS